MNSEVLNCNDEFLALKNLVESLGSNPGLYFIATRDYENICRMKNMGTKSFESQKKRRKVLRSQRKELIYKEKEKEKEGGESYCAGSF